jgi:hypothetical protein
MNSISCTWRHSLYSRFKGRVRFRLTIYGNEDSGSKEGGVGRKVGSRPTCEIGPQMEDEGGAYQAEGYPWRHEGNQHSGREVRQDNE